MEDQKIKILNLEFKIVETECIAHGSSEIGRIDYLNQNIYIYKNLSEEQKEQTLLHEILHGIFYQLGFNDECDNEHLIDSLATALVMLKRQNKKLG